MKLTTALGALALAACGPAAAPAPEPARCGPSVPPTAQHPISIRATSLAGEYQLIQVHSQPIGGVMTAAVLHLEPLDSTAKAAAVGGAVRDLTGWVEPADGAGEKLPAVLAGEHLRIGRVGGQGAQQLTITAVAPEGFWGWWKAEPGMAVHMEPDTRRLVPDPAGYFCALRRDSAR
jgi:hypothetical protein